jgi:hypothetical protein
MWGGVGKCVHVVVLCPDDVVGAYESTSWVCVRAR